MSALLIMGPPPIQSRRESDDLGLHVELSQQRHELLSDKQDEIKITIERIEEKLDAHVAEESMAFHSFYQFKAELGEMLVNHKDEIQMAVEPIKTEITKFKNYAYAGTAIIGFIWFIITTFGKYIDAILHMN